MKGGSSASGFTIVETLIVLAVTGVLIFGAILAVQGKTSKTEFTTAINSLQQQIQEIINETESGYYPNSGGTFSCAGNTSLGGGPPIITAGGTNTLGTNGTCTFLGKVIYFGPGQPGDTATSFPVYTVFPVAGNRLVPGGTTIATTLAQAWPVAISQGNTSNTLAPPGNFSSYTMENGLSFIWGDNPVDNTGQPYALAILSTLGNDASGGASGAQQFQLYGYTNSWVGNDTSSQDLVDNIYNATGSAQCMPTTCYNLLSNGDSFCVASGTTDESGLFTISAGLVVTLQVMEATTTCA